MNNCSTIISDNIICVKISIPGFVQLLVRTPRKKIIFNDSCYYIRIKKCDKI